MTSILPRGESLQCCRQNLRASRANLNPRKTLGKTFGKTRRTSKSKPNKKLKTDLESLEQQASYEADRLENDVDLRKLQQLAIRSNFTANQPKPL